jgi:hypothetical protein
MSTTPVSTTPVSTIPVRRHALGLPAGSIRATHILAIVALIAGILLIPTTHDISVPPYLVYLLFLGLGHFFAAHGSSIGQRATGGRSPLYLPAGTIRFLVIAILVGVIGWRAYQDPAALQRSFELSVDELKRQPEVLIAILSAFLLGVIVRAVVGRDNPPALWQDIEAWLSLVALVGLCVAALVHLVIGVSLAERLSLPMGEGFLGAFIAFYFGARS